MVDLLLPFDLGDIACVFKRTGIGLDIGYGVVKVVTDEDSFVFCR